MAARIVELRLPFFCLLLNAPLPIATAIVVPSGAIPWGRACHDVGSTKLEGAGLVLAEVRAELRHSVESAGAVEADKGRI